MKKDIFFIILEKTAKKGLYNSVDVSKEVQNYLRYNTNFKKEEKPVNWFDIPDMIFSPLKGKDYIHYIKFELPHEEKDPSDWINNIHVSASITVDGLAYYKTNKKSFWSNATIGISILSVIITAIGVFITYLDYSNKHNDKLLKKPKLSMKSQTQHQPSQSSIEKIPKTSHADLSHKH